MCVCVCVCVCVCASVCMCMWSYACDDHMRHLTGCFVITFCAHVVF